MRLPPRTCGLLVLALGIASVTSLRAANTATLASTSIPAGSTALLQVQTAANTDVVVVSRGPGPVADARARAQSAAPIALQVGPFTEPGEYRLEISAGADRATATLRVEWPRGDQRPTAPSPGSLGSAMIEALDAVQQAADASLQALRQLPAADGVAEAQRAAGELARVARELAQQGRDFQNAAARVDEALAAEPNADPAVVDQFARFSADTSQALRDQAEQLLALGREASGPQADACVRAEVAATALQAQQALTSMIRSGMLQYLAELAQDQSAEFSRGAAEWARARMTAGRPLASDPRPEAVSGGTVAPPTSSVSPRWDAAHTALTYLRAGVTGGPWGLAEQAVNDAVTGGLAVFTRSHCLTWSGEMSGTTDVEALDQGQPFYQLQNGWSGQVRLAGARPGSPGAAVAMRGMLFGRGKDFKVVNRLETLYAGRPASLIRYLTAQPSAAQRGTAVFAVSLEGTAQGNQLSLKVREGKVDYAGRVHGKLAAIVIPMASPVPLVQTYEVPFQGGHWQLMRALGANGITLQPIATSGNKRIVQAAYPRTLSNPGARGRFTISMKLCAGQCEGSSSN